MWTTIRRDPSTAWLPSADARDFFRATEPFSTAAYARTIAVLKDGVYGAYSVYGGDSVWVLRDQDAARGIVAYCGRVVFPVFANDLPLENAGTELLPAAFLSAAAARPPYAIHGSARSAAYMERALAEYGCAAYERIDYDLMEAGVPPKEALAAGPAELILRQPTLSDIERVFLLQSSYEQEELVSERRRFNPAVCRAVAERIIRRENILIAELNGETIGKINTNAAAPGVFQIGGVYVQPAYRGRGVASRMTAEFTRSLLNSGSRVSLFVKKTNHAARALYLRTGFHIVGDYRITYY
jgi:ribosomal protein S18 acetylase RimI-like enzyme